MSIEVRREAPVAVPPAWGPADPRGGQPPPGGRAFRAKGLVRDGTPLPAVRWPGRVDVVAEVPAAGVFLGLDRGGRPAALPAVRPRPIRIGLLGAPVPATVLAYRLLAVGCQVMVVTRGATHWRRLTAAVNTPRLTLVDRPVQWPTTPPSPPGTNPGPQALIIDSPMPPPPPWIGNRDWCTVVHVAPTMPAGSEFWAHADVLVATGQGHAESVARRWPRPDAALADDLRGGEIALADPLSTRAVSLLLTHTEQAAMQAGG